MLAKTISESTGISPSYLSKLMNALTGSDLLRAKRGYRGGFQLARPAEQISLLEVAEAVEGEAWRPQCLLGLADCSDARACPLHHFWVGERERIRRQLVKVSLADVAAFEWSGRGMMNAIQAKT